MVTMRSAFGQCLVELGYKRDDFVVLDADVAGGTGTHIFRSEFPDRFIQCGIAEQNMVSVAAGIASAGLIPVVTGYAVFLSMRAIEQVRNSIAYPCFNVKIVASHLGLDVGPDGATHQAIEDLAIFRAIPNFKVVAPADPIELREAFSAVLDLEGPVYFRTGRSPIQSVYEGSAGFKIGEASVLREGSDATIIAVGVMVKRALDAAGILEREGVSCRVVNMSTIKPLDETTVIESAERTGLIVTAEDHNILGGLGGAVAEVVARSCPVPVEMVGIKDCFGESGEPWELACKYGLTPSDIVTAVKRLLDR